MKSDREDDIRAGMNGYVTEPLRAKGLYEAIEGHSSPHSKGGAHIPRENRPEEPVFDCKLALARIEGDLELMRELAGLFFTEAPRLLAEVRSSTVRADGPALQRNAHKLKGAVGCFAAKPESTEGGRRVSVLKRQEGAPVLLG